MEKIRSSEITPHSVYLNRRQFIRSTGLLAGSAVLAACSPAVGPATQAENGSPTAAAGAASAPAISVDPGEPFAGATADELGDNLNTYEEITNYNNFYEFTTDKEDVARLSTDFRASPWQVEVGGLVNNPKTFDIDDLRKLGEEERIYRLRCVEAWSMVIPWVGFPLSSLLKEVDPKSEAKYVRFETLFDPEQMPGQKSRWYSWPYVEGLRMDEAMHDMTLMATGMYGLPLLPQNGAPIRLVVPWKYGFKSIKSVVKIDLVQEQPTSLWMSAAPNEYGFFANVNPDVNHPRWSQATERRIGELRRRETLPFNGYGEEVATLYDGMDLKANF